MKLFCKIAMFSMLLLTGSIAVTENIFARTIILITHSAQSERAELAKYLMIENEKIPASFIEIEEKKDPCIGEKAALLWLCLDQSFQLVVLSRSTLIAKKNWKIFRDLYDQK